METHASLESLLNETRTFEPPAAFQKRAHISSYESYQKLYHKSITEPHVFWDEVARELHWFKPYANVLDYPPGTPMYEARWFDGGLTNIAFNCLDRHLPALRDKVALRWQGEPERDTRSLTYGELHAHVESFAAGLKALGLTAGDRVAIYMGLVPEVAIAMLACARLGLIHTVIFGGFAADAVRDRILDAEASCVITQDFLYRRGAKVALFDHVVRSVQQCPSVKSIVVFNRDTESPPSVETTSQGVAQVHRFQDVMALGSGKPPAIEQLAAEHPLFILYTSGTTGKPKGVVHSTGGYMIGVYLTTRLVFDLKPEDVYWCTADVGWITGHSYVVYGPLLNGATVMLYEGALNHPDPDRVWSIIAQYGVNIFYTAPTAIRAWIRSGDDLIARHDLSSLRLLGTVGEPINPEAWMWYRKTIGNERCPIVDTWWQTETASIMMTPLPGATPMVPGSCTRPFFGISPKVLKSDGTEAKTDEGGYLVIDKPWPSMLRTLWRDHERFKETYFSKWGGVYFTGDGARKDAQGNMWVMGRIDDVVNVSGHRLGTAEVESVLVAHPYVAEAAVVARPDALTGQAIVAFVTRKASAERHDMHTLAENLKQHVANEIGKFARPAEIRFAEALPKTRSGKIMRRLLRSLAEGQMPSSDMSTLEDLSVLEKLHMDEA